MSTSEKMLLTEFGSLWSATVSPRRWWSRHRIPAPGSLRADCSWCGVRPALQTLDALAQVAGEEQLTAEAEQDVHEPALRGGGHPHDRQVDVGAAAVVGIEPVGPAAALAEG